MIDPGFILDAYVSMLRSIPELGNLEIVAHHGNYPEDRALDDAIRQLHPGEIIVAWDGTSQAESPNRGAIWAHSFLAAVKTADTTAGMSYSAIWTAFVDGIPSGGSVKALWYEFHPACHPINPPTASRAFTLTNMETGAGVEYFDIRFTVTEK